MLCITTGLTAETVGGPNESYNCFESHTLQVTGYTVAIHCKQMTLQVISITWVLFMHFMIYSVKELSPEDKHFSFLHHLEEPPKDEASTCRFFFCLFENEPQCKNDMDWTCKKGVIITSGFRSAQMFVCFSLRHSLLYNGGGSNSHCNSTPKNMMYM